MKRDYSIINVETQESMADGSISGRDEIEIIRNICQRYKMARCSLSDKLFFRDKMTYKVILK